MCVIKPTTLSGPDAETYLNSNSHANNNIELNDLSKLKCSSQSSGTVSTASLDSMNINAVLKPVEKSRVNATTEQPQLIESQNALPPSPVLSVKPVSIATYLPTEPVPVVIDVDFDEKEVSSILTLNNLRKGQKQKNSKPKMHLRTLPAVQPEVREEQEITELSPLFQRSDSAKSC